MDSSQAQRVVESLRKGIPPDGFIRFFTVGRKKEIIELLDVLDNNKVGALLLKANYGSGKTHLLRFVRENALEKGYAVSLVSLDCRAGVRFNRMDQIFGAICRNLEVPSEPGVKGIRPFFDFIFKKKPSLKVKKNIEFWQRLSNDNRWDYSEILDSPALFIALRAWAFCDIHKKNIIEDWLYNPWNYSSQRKELYLKMVADLRSHFRDPRPDWKFYKDGIFVFNVQDYAQSWAALRDLNTMAQACGLRGLVLLFDEFEDIITNIKNIAHQEAAFWNLFQFYSGKQFPSLSFYAVTPDFTEKCVKVLVDKERYDFDYSHFQRLPTFEMKPLTNAQLAELAFQISQAHQIAYNWDPDSRMTAAHFVSLIQCAANVQIQDRARHTIVTVVRALDDLYEKCQ